MTKVSDEQRFRGAVRLVTWHLWRVGQSTNLEACFAEARKRSMIDESQEAFIRKCLEAEQLLSEGSPFDETLGHDAIHELQMCAIRLDTADSA